MPRLKYYNPTTEQWENVVVGGQGEQGDVGPANTLAVGTVDDSAPGSTPEVTITGTAPNQTINFVLPTGADGADSTVPGPQGDPGEQGEPGPGVASGGLEGQILAKLTDDDYDTTWIDNYAGELRIIVKNDSGVTINKGEAVMAVDAVGDRIKVAKAVADGSVSARYMLGVAAEAIADSAEGYISLLGEIKNLNTSAYTVGTVLFIDPDVAGGLTDDEPESPALDMSIAIVTRSHATTGILFIRMWIQGVNLGEVNNVAITEPADNQILAYDETAELWKNINIPESAAVISSATAPENTTAIWFNTENGNTYIYYDDFWTSISGDSGAPIISDTAPSSPVVGMEWFNSSNGKSYLYYSNAWVELDSSGSNIPTFANAAARTAAIPTPIEGQVSYLNDTDVLQTHNGTIWTTPSNLGGLVLVRAQVVGTGVTSVAVNDVFSATYDNYIINYSNGNGNSAFQFFNIQLHGITSGYYSNRQTNFVRGGGFTSAATDNASSFDYCGFGSSTACEMNVMLGSPFLNKRKRFWTGYTEMATDGIAGSAQGMNVNTTSSTGFTLLISPGTMTGGTIRVYGYRNS
jgi:hypothetical protein